MRLGPYDWKFLSSYSLSVLFWDHCMGYFNLGNETSIDEILLI